MSSSPNILEPMITAKEAAGKMGCSSRTIKRLAEERKIPGMRIGNRWMFLPSLLDKWRKGEILSNFREVGCEERGHGTRAGR